MDNKDQCPNELIYNSFSIIQLQTFCSDKLEVNVEDDLLDDDVTAELLEEELDEYAEDTDENEEQEEPEDEDDEDLPFEEEDPRFIQKFKDPVDCQLFTRPQNFYSRYNLKGFNVKIEIADEEKTVLEGRVHVRAIKFFDTCMQLSYRFVVVEKGRIGKTRFCTINHPFNTNQLIITAGIVQKVEYWATSKKSGVQKIDGIIRKITISGLHLDQYSNYQPTPYTEDVNSLEEVMKRYRYYFDKAPRNENNPAGLHTFIDVCDNIEHTGPLSFMSIKEAEIIEHIEQRHKAELIGIMSLYPKEWPYRMDDSYNDICGKNIAIDTDDLVLTNQNISLVLGTYGKRGADSPIDWKRHLKRRDAYHVCWPEYLILIELILAKKQTINYAIAKYIEKSDTITKSAKEDDKKRLRETTRDSIEANANLSIKISNIILQLNSIRYLRYVSHRHMFKMAEQNIGVPTDERYLSEVITRIDNSLNNANNNIELKQADKSNNRLFVISLASLIGVSLQIIIPTLLSEKSCTFKLTFIVGTILVTVWVLFHIFRYHKWKKKRQ